MKPYLIALFLSLPILAAYGQTESGKVSYTTQAGIGTAMNSPASTPIYWQIMGHYHINNRFAIGAGSGISAYAKTLIPLYASAQFFITRHPKYKLYLECNAGGSFAPEKNADGGFYLSPAIGMQLPLMPKLKAHFAIGYELQKLSRLKENADSYFNTGFQEELSHNCLTFKLGVTL